MLIELLLFWALFAVVTAFLAANRGKNSFKWFALGLLLGPLAFMLAVRPSSVAKGNPDEQAESKK
ncbi:MAG: hypothetical protein PHN75_12510 [Syntrophales bacterium]|nr:hypothetical protein [Syntrophales bacterium]